jgi:hypothetical protein
MLYPLLGLASKHFLVRYLNKYMYVNLHIYICIYVYICIYIYVYSVWNNFLSRHLKRGCRRWTSTCAMTSAPCAWTTCDAAIKSLLSAAGMSCILLLMRCGQGVMYPPPHAMRPRSHYPLLPEAEGKKTIL